MHSVFASSGQEFELLKPLVESKSTQHSMSMHVGVSVMTLYSHYCATLQPAVAICSAVHAILQLYVSQSIYVQTLLVLPSSQPISPHTYSFEQNKFSRIAAVIVTLPVES